MRHVLAALITAAALAAPATAAPITVSVNFTASGFPSAAPTDPVTGAVTFTADPAVPGPGIVNDFQMAIGGMSYATAEVIAGTLAVVGNDCSGAACAVNSAIPGFAMSFADWATPQISMIGFSYSVGDGAIYAASAFSVSLAAVPAHLPLPIVALFLAGIALLGHRAKRGGRIAAVA